MFKAATVGLSAERSLHEAQAHILTATRDPVVEDERQGKRSLASCRTRA